MVRLLNIHSLQDYEASGGKIVDKAGVFDSDIVLKLRQPSIQEAAHFREESILYSFLYPAQNKELIDTLAARKLTAFGKSHNGTLSDSLFFCFKSAISFYACKTTSLLHQREV